MLQLYLLKIIRFPFAILVLVALSNSFIEMRAQLNVKNDIEWDENRPLVWMDFKGKPPSRDIGDAVSSSSIYIGWKQLQSGMCEFKVITYFSKEDSWVKKKTPHLLVHERLHFDISEIYARKLRQRLYQHQFQRASLDKEVEKIYKDTFSEMEDFQILYDKETKHSLIKERQEHWNVLVDSLLSAHNRYKETDFKIWIMPE